jgi:hypothetical protein
MLLLLLLLVGLWLSSNALTVAVPQLCLAHGRLLACYSWLPGTAGSVT